MKTFIYLAATVESKSGWTKTAQLHGKPVGIPVKGLDVNYNVQKEPSLVCEALIGDEAFHCTSGFSETSVCHSTCAGSDAIKIEKVCSCHRMIGTAKLFRGCKWINTTENDCAVKEKEQVQMIAEKIEAAEKNKTEKGDEKENNQEIKSSEKKIKYFSDNCEQLEDIENWSCEKANNNGPVVMTCSRLCQTKDRFRTIRSRCICIAGQCRWQKTHVQSCPSLKAGLLLPPVSLKSAGRPSSDESSSESLFAVFSDHVTDKHGDSAADGKYVHPFEFLQKFQGWMYDSGLLSPQNKDLLIEM
jgi:hypothetical protein